MRKYLILVGLLAVALLTTAGQITTGARCSVGADCSIGGGAPSSFTIDTANMNLDIHATNDDTLTLTATSTNTAVFQGADAGGAASTTFDTTGAGAIVLGSADVTTIDLVNTGAITVGASTTDSVSIVTAGGTVTIDGSIVSQVAVNSLTAGTLVANTINLATASGDYDIPNTFCATAANVGNWITIVIEDDDTDVSITVNDTNNQMFVPGLDLGADDELDNVKTAAHESQNITFTCVATDKLYMTAGVLTLSTSGTIAWADGGTAD